MEPWHTSYSEVEKEIRKLSPAVYEEYRKSRIRIDERLSPEQSLTWARHGVIMATLSPRSWEATLEYFRASPHALEALSPAQFLDWTELGVLLCRDSSIVAVAYFGATPAAFGLLQQAQLRPWAQLGRRLYNGSWKSAKLTASFFENSPRLLRHLTFGDLELFTDVLDTLGHVSHEAANECLLLGIEVFPRLGAERRAFISVALAEARHSWRETKDCFEAAKGFSLDSGTQYGRVMALAERLAKGGVSGVPGFLTDSIRALQGLDGPGQEEIIGLAESLAAQSLEVVPPFFSGVTRVLGLVGQAQLDIWVRRGVQVLRENPEAGLAFFRQESVTSVELLKALSSSVELEGVKEILKMYCRALAGAGVEIMPAQELVEKGIGWVSEDRASIEGKTIYLPGIADRYVSKADNFAWLKVNATHQIAHLEFGSFDFSFDRPSNLFTDERIELLEGKQRRNKPTRRGKKPSSGANGAAKPLSDMERLFNLFDNRRLALDIFTALEDTRLDYRVMLDYPGILPYYRRAQEEALAVRPPIQLMRAQTALVECLIRLSLLHEKGMTIGEPYTQVAQGIILIARRLLDANATVEDTAEATIRIYNIIYGLFEAPMEISDEKGIDLGLDDHGDEQESEGDQEGSGEPSEEGAPGDDAAEDYESPPQVDYRGDFKPELVQLLANLKKGLQKDAPELEAPPMSLESLEQTLSKSVELERTTSQDKPDESMRLYALNIMKEASVPPQGDNQGMVLVPDEESQEPLESSEPKAFVYDEWDFRAADYKSRWCIVREKHLEEGEVEFFNDTLHEHWGLVSQIRRQFQMMIPEAFQKVKRLQDGEEFELDAVIEAVMDRRLGVTPSDKLYWRRNKIERDVAAVFLVDMSASTAEAIGPGNGGVVVPPEAPKDPIELMNWIRARQSAGDRGYKRIIDMEKESAVLLISALETTGDIYGIYGFSSYGRENVDFYIIKDVDEPFSDKVKRRIDKISPLHATRMGPAIRHATYKLDHQDAKTKLLFLLSDGRPQDRGYSREGMEREYAVHDTRMALLEARGKRITPFCLTVDRLGHDYLKTMCSDMGYEILPDIHSLPRRLPMLYRKLTV